MRKITDFIVKHKYLFLIIFISATVISFYLQFKVNINDDIMKYLPKSSETKIGNDIMTDSFAKQDTSELYVMFKNLEDDDKTLAKFEKISGVSSAIIDAKKKYKGDNYTLYKLQVSDYSDSKTAAKVYQSVDKNFKYSSMSGSIFDENQPLLPIYIVVLAVSCALVILIILSDSWFEPFLYLITIGIAIVINKGTNVMFDSVSAITNSIVAILQLALSMDYSIMLSNRYKQEKLKSKNNTDAMKEALYQSFKAIISSSLTTIVGLLALVFMSFTIGKDLGFVLAKGVLFSLISIFCCLPALLLMFDKFLGKTKKKAFKFNLKKLGSYSYKTRFAQLFIIIGLFIGAFLIKGSVDILYTDMQEDKIGQVFGSNNQIAIVYENKYSDKVNEFALSVSDDEKVTNILSNDFLLNRKMTSIEAGELVRTYVPGISIDSSVIGLLYYINFDGKVHDNMSINEITKLLKEKTFISDLISIKTKANELKGLDLDKKISYIDAAKIFGVRTDEFKVLYLYYNSLINYNDNWMMTLNELITFIKSTLNSNQDILNLIPREKVALLNIGLGKFDSIINLFVSDDYSRTVFNTLYPKEGNDTFKFVKKLKDYFDDDDGVYIVGISPMAYEMSQSFNDELNKITILTMIFIFTVVAFTFKDLIIPFVLVLIIQCAVYITMSYISLTGGNVYFLSMLIVQAVLMGATIDYAIVYTSYYKEERKNKNIKDAITAAYNGSINTIITSSSILIIATLIVANFASEIAAKICETVSQGTLCSLILVLFILPGVLAATDRLICRSNYKKKSK